MAEAMSTSDVSLPVQPATASITEHMFPTLSAAQMARMAAHGRRRSVAAGEVLVEVGDAAVPLCVVVSGEVHGLRPTDEVERQGLDIVEHGEEGYTAA